MGNNWPMIERELEFARIRDALGDKNGHCGVVLTGDAGVGKTTLARYAVDGMELQVRWVAGTVSARSIPLGVFAHLVGPATSSDPVTYLAAARESLLSNGHPVIGVDDAHLLDELSATLLHQLAIDKAVHIIATVRSGEAVPDAITSLWKDDHVVRVALTPFSKEQSVELVERVLGGRLEGLSADLMWDASGGNALFLRHLVQGAVESGSLREVNNVWQLRGRATITSELAALLESRIDRLDDDVTHVLQLLTLCEPIDLDVLMELAGERPVENAEDAGLIRIGRDGRALTVRYAHPLFGEVIRKRLGFAASRRLRGKLVSALRTRPLRTASDRIRLAGLALESDADAERSTVARRSGSISTNSGKWNAPSMFLPAGTSTATLPPTEASTWAKGRNSLGSWSAAMPIPVSSTSQRRCTPSLPSPINRTRTTTRPLAVNLTALAT